MERSVIKHSVLVSGQKTSISLEDEFWNSLREIAGERRKTLSGLLTSIDARRKRSANLSSSTRTYILHHYRSQVMRRGGIIASAGRRLRIRSRRTH
jgi:predicted DNA-binding ribbon-helix-helix protein